MTIKTTFQTTIMKIIPPATGEMTTRVMTKTMEIFTKRMILMTIRTTFQTTIMKIIPPATGTMTTTVMTNMMKIFTVSDEDGDENYENCPPN